MKKFFLALFSMIVALNACSLPLTPTSSPPTVTATATQTATATPPTYGGCGYQWANYPLPELSAEFQTAIQNLQPEVQANAFAFGEDCIHADGKTRTFIAMETDFNVTVQISDLSDEAALGEWIVKVMEVIENIPPEKIMGPRPGMVNLGFQSGSEQKFVHFYINEYQGLPPGLSSAEIYQALQTQQ